MLLERVPDPLESESIGRDGMVHHVHVLASLQYSYHEDGVRKDTREGGGRGRAPTPTTRTAPWMRVRVHGLMTMITSITVIIMMIMIIIIMQEIFRGILQHARANGSCMRMR